MVCQSYILLHCMTNGTDLTNVIPPDKSMSGDSYPFLLCKHDVFLAKVLVGRGTVPNIK